MTFLAQFTSGTCADCTGAIAEGDEITRNLEKEYIHVDCPDTELDRLAKLPVCPSCFMIGPCECD
jgi:hypothetical protein